MPSRQPDDPETILTLAAQTLRLIGRILLLLAPLAMMFTLVNFRAIERFFQSDIASLWVTLFIGASLVGGIGFVVVAGQLPRRRPRAAVAAITLTAILFLAALTALVQLALLMLAPGGSPVLIALVVVVALFTYAVGEVLHHLTRTPDAIRQLQSRSAGVTGGVSISAGDCDYGHSPHR